MSDELNKQDLFILMESYKNNIQLNTTILEQQRQMLIMNDQFIERQKELCASVDNLINRISDCSRVLIDNHAILTNSIRDLSTNVHTALETMSNKLLLENVNGHAKLSVEHSGLANRLYVSMGGMIIIILSLIGLFQTFSHKFEGITTLIKSITG